VITELISKGVEKIADRKKLTSEDLTVLLLHEQSAQVAFRDSLALNEQKPVIIVRDATKPNSPNWPRTKHKSDKSQGVVDQLCQKFSISRLL
jgi:hypothetical protein